MKLVQADQTLFDFGAYDGGLGEVVEWLIRLEHFLPGSRMVDAQDELVKEFHVGDRTNCSHDCLIGRAELVSTKS
jgi:hypothetical protein